MIGQEAFTECGWVSQGDASNFVERSPIVVRLRTPVSGFVG